MHRLFQVLALYQKIKLYQFQMGQVLACCTIQVQGKRFGPRIASILLCHTSMDILLQKKQILFFKLVKFTCNVTTPRHTFKKTATIFVLRSFC